MLNAVNTTPPHERPRTTEGSVRRNASAGVSPNDQGLRQPSACVDSFVEGQAVAGAEVGSLIARGMARGEWQSSIPANEQAIESAQETRV
jgi:hypothetical protein